MAPLGCSQDFPMDTRQPPADPGDCLASGDRLSPSRLDLAAHRLDVREGEAARRIVGSDADSLEQVCPAFSPDGRRLAHGEAEVTDPAQEAPMQDGQVRE